MKYLILLLCIICVAVQADEMRATLLVETPTPSPTELLLPRTLAASAALNRCYVLDSGLHRIVALTADGVYAAHWPLSAFDIDLAGNMPADPLLPAPALVTTRDGVLLLVVNRAKKQLDIAVVDGEGDRRTVPLPDGSSNGAFTLDADGRALGAYLRVTNSKAALVLARETADGTLETLTTLDDPCDDAAKNLVFTGIACSPEGRLAIGLAQGGDASYRYTRSWLVECTQQDGKITSAPAITRRGNLLDPRGKLLERYRVLAELAGREGYPDKPCVPLFTSLALTADGALLSGGHTVDPFLRVYTADGHLVFSQPRQAVGGQHIALLAGKATTRLFATDPADGLVEELTIDGHRVGVLGRPCPFTLADPVAITADRRNVYVAARRNNDLSLLRFNVEGRLLWSIPLARPAGMDDALPHLAVSTDRVLIGWRQPKAAGLSWLTAVQDDGLPGLPVWDAPYLSGKPFPGACPTPLVTGDNGRVYALRETPTGPRLQAVSLSGGPPLQEFPPELQGVTAVDKEQNLAWARMNGVDMVIARYSPQGVERGWKYVRRDVQGAALLPTPAGDLWAWFTGSHTLLRFDDKMTVTDEDAVLDPDGVRLESVLAVTGDRNARIYLAVPNRILVVKMGEE